MRLGKSINLEFWIECKHWIFLTDCVVPQKNLSVLLRPNNCLYKLLLLFYTNSSFDEYSSELKSGRLEWSPVHKSEKFWRENAVRLNEKNYELLK